MADKPAEFHVDHALLSRVLATIEAPVVVTDRRGTILWTNDAFCRVTGYGAEVLRGESPAILKSGVQDAAFYRHLWGTIRSGTVWRGELVNRRRDGTVYEVEEVITPLIDGGEPTHFVGVQHDVTERRRADRRREHQALHDDLTGLPNRMHFLDALHKAVREGAIAGRRSAVAFVDLDGFKAVNDRFGHLKGDGLLQAVARRLRACVSGSDMVARLGGDEFAVLMQDALVDALYAPALAETIVRSLARPFVIRGEEMAIGASVGLAGCPEDGQVPGALLAYADAAMYRVKVAGGGGWCAHGGAVWHGPKLPGRRCMR